MQKKRLIKKHTVDEKEQVNLVLTSEVDEPESLKFKERKFNTIEGTGF